MIERYKRGITSADSSDSVGDKSFDKLELRHVCREWKKIQKFLLAYDFFKIQQVNELPDPYAWQSRLLSPPGSPMRLAMKQGATKPLDRKDTACTACIATNYAKPRQA